MASQKEQIPLPLSAGKFLGEEYPTLPAGRIFKRYTGIGATTVEINDQSRNSIIVCPTRALAASKAISEEILYRGGDYPGISSCTTEEIQESLKDSSIKTKIMVVADSLINLYDELGEQNKSFFFMFDEIDSFQSESSYRPNFEKCLDIYFQVDKNKRNMVSATIMDSLDARIKDEDYYYIEIPEYSLPVTNVIHAPGELTKTLASKVEECYENLFGGDKIVIGYNSIYGIQKTISLLAKELRGEVGILCSKKSRKKFPSKYRTNLNEGKLEKKITFITAAYFVGIDINESCHVFAVSDTSYPTSFLFLSKIYQIFGRVRKGVTSQSFIFNTSPKLYKDIEEHYKWIIDKYSRAYAKAKAVLGATTDTSEEEKKETVRDVEAITNSTAIHDAEVIRLLNGTIAKCTFNIDYLYHRQRNINELCTDSTKTQERLSDFFKVVYEEIDSTVDESDKESISSYKAEKLDYEQQHALLLLDSHNRYGEYVEPISAFEELIVKILALPGGKSIKDDRMKAIRGVIRQTSCNKSKLNTLYEQVAIKRIITLSATNKALTRKVNPGAIYTSEEIHRIMTEVAGLSIFEPFSDIIKKEIVQKEAVRIFNKLFETKRNPIKEKDGKTVQRYNVVKINTEY